MTDLEEKDAVKTPTVVISPSFLYGVRAGVKVGGEEIEQQYQT